MKRYINIQKIAKVMELKEEDIVEKFIHSTGNGSQNVNKVATCVYLKHIPTGIEVKCHEHRSQGANRRMARRLLTAKINAYLAIIKDGMKSEYEKSIRRNRKRPKFLKERILNEKKFQSEKKLLRKRIL